MRLASTAPRLRVALIGVLLLIMTTYPVVSSAAPGDAPAHVTRVSVSSSGEQGDAHSMSWWTDFDDTGRYVAFGSTASNLVPGDDNGVEDVFVHDRRTGTTERVSLTSAGAQATGRSWQPWLSSDARLVCFGSEAQLVAEDTNGNLDIYLHDRDTGATSLVSVTPSGTAGSGDSINGKVSADGSCVVFGSEAADLVSGDTNGEYDVFVRDLTTGVTERISTATGGAEVAGQSLFGSISGDGRLVTFTCFVDSIDPLDSNGVSDVFVKDRESGETTLVSVSTGGIQGTAGVFIARISDDGRVVVFGSWAPNLVPGDTNGERDVFVRHLESGVTDCVSVGPDGNPSGSGAGYGYPSSDGRFVAFVAGDGPVADDTNGQWDTYVRDLLFDRTAWASRPPASAVATQPSGQPGISGNGLAVAFYSAWGGFVPGDTNGVVDVFVATFGADTLEIAGDDRYATAAAASREGFPFGADAVVIATGEAWPDALGGAALAGALDAPLLLTGRDRLSLATAYELGRLGVTEAYVLGGTGAVSANVVSQIEALVGSDSVTRLAGANRYATARAVADETIGILGAEYDGRAFVARGDGFADALAASPIAAAKGWPILLAEPDDMVSLPVRVAAATILGGTGAVSSQTQSFLETALGAPSVDRIAGGDRYETGVSVADFGVSEGLHWDFCAVATGETFPDGLAGGPMLATRRSVLLLSAADALSPPTSASLSAHQDDIGYIRLLGGPAALSQTVRDEIATVLPR